MTIIQPEDGTLPMPGLIETVLAPSTAQVKVILSPSMIESRLAEKVFTTGGSFVMAVFAVLVVPEVSTTTVTVRVTEP